MLGVFEITIDTNVKILYTDYDVKNLAAKQRGTKWITYFYGVDGVAGFEYDNSTYVYRKNVQGDVTHIYKQEKDKSLTFAAQYVYDAWGNHKVLNAEGVEVQSTETVIANINPFRYRSYYFDVETQLYYLQTRYYDASIGRFISADSIEYLDPETLGRLNLYTYCDNNPKLFTDSCGNFAIVSFLISLAIGALINFALTQVLGEQIAGGIGSVAGGASAIATGVSLCAFGPIGWVLGLSLIAVGACTVAFGANEVVSGITGTNVVRDWMGDSLYDGLYIACNVVSSVGAIAGNLGMQHISNIKMDSVMQNPQTVQKWSKFQFKTYARYSNEWTLSPSRNGKGMRALSNLNKGNSIRYGYGINNAEHFWGSLYWIVVKNGQKIRFPFK